MNSLFSNSKLIDTILIVDIDYVHIQQKNKIAKKIEHCDSNEHPKFKYRILNYFPKIQNQGSIDYDFYLQNLPHEDILLSKVENRFFSYSYLKNNRVYYSHYLKVCEEIKDEKQYLEVPEEYKHRSLYGFKYLIILSEYPFFFSFNSLLEQLYFNSFRANQDIKTESILNYYLFRLSLPKYDDTQITFVLNSQVYNFNNNLTYSEIPVKLLFSILSIENVVKIFLGLLTNSTIIIAHSNIEIISPIISILISLILPFPSNYSIIANLNKSMIEMLDYPVFYIVGIYKNDFGDIDEIIMKYSQNKNSYIIVDLDNNGIISYSAEIGYNELKLQEDILERRLNKLSNIHDPNNTFNIKSIQSEFHYKNNNIILKNPHLFKSEGRDDIKLRSIKEKIFKENKIRAVFLDFILSLLDSFDESKHFEFDKKVIFNSEKFILDSKPDVQGILKIIVNLPYFDTFIFNILDFKYKEKLKGIKKKKDDKPKIVITNFEKYYDIFIRAQEKRKDKKNLSIIFKHFITHTISLPGICPEIACFKQKPIFSNVINEILFRHKKSLDFSEPKYKLNLLYHDFSNSLYYRSIFHVDDSRNLIDEFLKIYQKNFEIMERFYGLYIKKNERSDPKNTVLKESTLSREDYLNLFNEYFLKNKKKSLNLNYEFNLNFGNYTVQTSSICSHCKVPNSIWEIRRNIKYGKNEKESKVCCKNCRKYFFAYFIIMNIENTDLDHTNTFLTENQSNLKGNEIKPISKKNYEKIKYMSIDHIISEITNLKSTFRSDFTNRSIGKNIKIKDKKEKSLINNNENIKKNYPHLYHNILLLLNDLKIRVANLDDMLLINDINDFIKDETSRLKSESIASNIYILDENKIVPKDETFDQMIIKKKIVESIKKVVKIDLSTLKSEAKFQNFQEKSSLATRIEPSLILGVNQIQSHIKKYLNSTRNNYENHNENQELNNSSSSLNMFLQKKSGIFDQSTLINQTMKKNRSREILNNGNSKGEFGIFSDKNNYNDSSSNYYRHQSSSIGSFNDNNIFNFGGFKGNSFSLVKAATFHKKDSDVNYRGSPNKPSKKYMDMIVKKPSAFSSK